jgi:biopolymer transport protein ExbD
MHGSSARGPGKRARIEIIPLIDIIFFLLATFIMVSLSMSKNQGMNVALPSEGIAATDTSSRDKDKPVAIKVDQKGEVLYNNQKITMAQLPLRLQAYKSSAKDPKVTVSGDGDASVQAVIAVYDQARLVGIQKVALNPGR